MTIGETVRAERKRLGLTQEALARRADMSKSGVQMIEHGQRTDLPYSSLKKLSGALGLTIGELVGEPVPLAPAPSASPPPDVGVAEAGQPRVAVEMVADALASYPASRIRAYEEDLRDPDSPHFKTATTAALWGEMLHRESGMLIDSMMAQSGPVIRSLGSTYERAFAGVKFARAIGKTVAAFNKTRQLADQRIAAMRDVPDELAQKRLEKARRGAEESAHRFEELQRDAL